MEQRKFYFENLDVWQRGRVLIKEVYKHSQFFPSEEKFGMTSQIRRACISINCNIAEGISRQSGKEQARFTEIAYGSLMETMNLLILATDLEFLPGSAVDEIRPLFHEVGNKLNSLREAQLKRP